MHRRGHPRSLARGRGRRRDPIGVAQHTALLGEPIGYTRDTNGGLAAWTENGGNPLEIRDDFGYLWTTLATEPVAMFDIPEVREPDRRTLAAVTVGIETSAPRSPR